MSQIVNLNKSLARYDTRHGFGMEPKGFQSKITAIRVFAADKGVIMHADEAAIRMTGREIVETLGKPMGDLPKHCQRLIGGWVSKVWKFARGKGPLVVFLKDWRLVKQAYAGTLPKPTKDDLVRSLFTRRYGQQAYSAARRAERRADS